MGLQTECAVTRYTHIYHGVLDFQNSVGFHGARFNVIPLVHVRKLRPSLDRFSPNSQILIGTVCRFLCLISPISIINEASADRNLVTPLSNTGLPLGQFRQKSVTTL